MLFVKKLKSTNKVTVVYVHNFDFLLSLDWHQVCVVHFTFISLSCPLPIAKNKIEPEALSIFLSVLKSHQVWDLTAHL